MNPLLQRRLKSLHAKRAAKKEQRAKKLSDRRIIRELKAEIGRKLTHDEHVEISRIMNNRAVKDWVEKHQAMPQPTPVDLAVRVK